MNQDDLFEPAPKPTPKPPLWDDLHMQPILAELAVQPQTTDALAARLGFTIENTRRAVRLLFEAGKVEDSGDRSATASYSHAVVWRVKP